MQEPLKHKFECKRYLKFYPYELSLDAIRETAASPIHSIPTILCCKAQAYSSRAIKVPLSFAIDFNNSQFNSTLYVLNKNDNSIVKQMSFSDDFLAATIHDGILYIFNSGLGYILNATTGSGVKRILTIDNYRDIVQAGNNTTMQTSAVIAGLYADGSLGYQSKPLFNDIAYGCITRQPTSL